MLRLEIARVSVQISDNLGFSREDPDEEKVAVLSEIIKVDEIVYVKVTEVRDAEPGSSRGPKIGCSIKLVSQRDGADLDPNNLKFRPRQADGPGFGARAPVGANAGQIQQGEERAPHNQYKHARLAQTG